MTPVLFLDVDGVLNPLTTSRPKQYGRGLWTREQCPGSHLRLWLNPALGAALLGLGVDIVWATTWCGFPDDLEWVASRSGLPAGLPRITLDPDDADDFRNCGKRRGVAAWLAGAERPVVWVDDDLGPGDREWASNRPGRTLLVKPLSGRGLDRSHIDRIASFLAGAEVTA